MKFKSDFKDVHKAEKRSALLLFSGLFGLPLLTGFIAISSGASETAGLAVVIVTLIAFVGLAHWHEEGIKRDRKKQWHADVKRAADKFGWESSQVAEIREFERAYLAGYVETDETFFTSVFDNDPLNQIPSDDFDKLVEAEKHAADKEGRPFDWGEVHGYQLDRYLSDKPALKAAYAAYEKRINEKYPLTAQWFENKNASHMRYVNAFKELSDREKQLWEKLITKPAFAAAYASHRSAVNNRHPEAESWFKKTLR